MEKNKLLNDEELEKVAGGKTKGSIEYVEYSKFEPYQFYASSDKMSYVYLFHEDQFGCSYCSAKVSYDGTYWSRSMNNTQCGACGQSIFKDTYRYKVVFYQ